MSHTKQRTSVVKATKGNYVVYLSQRDVEYGLDIKMDMQGYTIEAI